MKRWGLPLFCSILPAVLTGCLPSVGEPGREPAAGIRFRNVAAEAGVRFELGHGGRSPLTILETLGHGCAFLDYDGDSALDLLLLGDKGVALYRGDGRGQFREATGTAGLRKPGYWHGVATGDLDNDGDADLCLAGYRCLALMRNEGGRFTDISRTSGLARPEWGSSCGFTDLDGDGLLDLVMAEYLEFGPHSVQFCTVNDIRSACGPKIYPARYPRVYRNRGGRFEDVTHRWGFSSANGKALGVAFGDFNQDGRIDVAVANDEMPQDLFIRGEGPSVRFRNEGLKRAFSYLSTGKVQSGMGIDAADYDGDGAEDVVITNFQNEPAGLYRNQRDFFQEISARAGLSEASFPFVGWGTRFFDPDNDGDLDLLMANGHIQDNAHLTEAYTTYAQPSLLLENDGRGGLRRLGPSAGPDIHRTIVGRGLASGDYDSDGRVDAVVVDLEGAPLLLHNESPAAGNWVGLEVLTGSPPRHALGALVTLELPGKRLHRRVGTAGSIFSAHDPRVHFGLGDLKEAGAVTVRWPDGVEERFPAPAANRYQRLLRRAPAGKTGSR